MLKGFWCQPYCIFANLAISVGFSLTYFGGWYISCLTEVSVFHSWSGFIVNWTYWKVCDIKTLLIVFQTWLSMWDFPLLLEIDMLPVLQRFPSSSPSQDLLSLGHTGKVSGVKTRLLFLQMWPSVWDVLSSVSSHFKSCSDFGLNISLVFLPQCVIGISYASNMS